MPPAWFCRQCPSSGFCGLRAATLCTTTRSELCSWRGQRRVHDCARLQVPSWDWINLKLARGPTEFQAFQRIDEEEAWYPEKTLAESPAWIRFTAEDVQARPAGPRVLGLSLWLLLFF